MYFILQIKTDLPVCSFKWKKLVEPDFGIYQDAFDCIIKARYLLGIIYV